MKENNYTMRLIDEITAYLNFLIFSQKLDVCICDIYRSLPPAWCEAFSSFVHTNPYCQKIKHLKNGQRQCFLMQQFVRKHCLEDKVFFGNCYAGVSEYIFPSSKTENITDLSASADIGGIIFLLFLKILSIPHKNMLMLIWIIWRIKSLPDRPLPLW